MQIYQNRTHHQNVIALHVCVLFWKGKQRPSPAPVFPLAAAWSDSASVRIPAIPELPLLFSPNVWRSQPPHAHVRACRKAQSWWVCPFQTEAWLLLEPSVPKVRGQINMACDSLTGLSINTHTHTHGHPQVWRSTASAMISLFLRILPSVVGKQLLCNFGCTLDVQPFCVSKWADDR